MSSDNYLSQMSLIVLTINGHKNPLNRNMNSDILVIALHIFATQ